MEFEKNCNNCRFFLKHYTINNLRFTNVGGHCINTELCGKLKNRSIVRNNCNYWEPYEIQVKERREKMQNTIRKMEKELSNILLILKNDIE